MNQKSNFLPQAEHPECARAALLLQMVGRNPQVRSWNTIYLGSRLRLKGIYNY